jgi:hypothetical protein
VSGWGASDLLPGGYFLLLGAALAAALRRWYDALPRWAAALFLALPVLLFAAALGGGRVLLPVGLLRSAAPFQELAPDPAGTALGLQRDLVRQIAPWTLEVKRALLAGRWPLWNQLAGAGMPLMADPQSQPFQPLVAIAYPFSVWRAAAISAALRVHLALVFTFLLLRRQGLGEAPALCGSLAFGLGSFLLLWLGWPIANCAALLPACLYAAALCDARGARRDFALLAGAAAALLLAGHPETMLYALALLGLFLAARAAALHGAARWRLLARTAAALGLAAGLAAPPLLLARAYLPTTLRADAVRSLLAARPPGELWRDLRRPETLAGWSRRSVARLLQTAAPRALGDQRSGYRGDTDYIEDASGFAGTATLLAAALGLAGAVPLAGGGAGGGRRRRPLLPQERLMRWVLLASLVLLAQPPGCENLLARVPLAGITAVHDNGRIQLLVGFCLAYLAACALERWTRGVASAAAPASAAGVAAEPRGEPASPIAGGATGDALPAAGPSARHRFAWRAWRAGFAGRAERSGLSGRSGRAEHAAGHAWRLAVAAAVLVELGVLAWGYLGHLPAGPGARLDAQPLRWLGLQAAVAAAAAALLAAPPARRRLAAWALCGLVGGELLCLNASANPAGPAQLAFPVTPPVAFLIQRLGSDRMVGIGRSFPANYPEVYGLDDVRIDNPAMPDAYQRVVQLLDSGGAPQPMFGRPEHPFYDFLGVRYVIARPDVEVPLPVALRDPAGWIYERPRPLPRLSLPERVQADRGAWRDWFDGNDDFGLRAMAAPAPDAPDLVRRRWRAERPPLSRLAVGAIAAERVSARATLVERRLLASSIYQDGAWHLLAGGVRRPGVLVNGAFAGGWLPAGTWDVELVYRPPALLAGCLLTALALAVAAAWWMPAPVRGGGSGLGGAKGGAAGAAPVLSWIVDGG